MMVTVVEKRRREIMSFWDSTEKDLERRKRFIAFMSDKGITQNTMYIYMRCECRNMPYFKLLGILECIKEFEKEAE